MVFSFSVISTSVLIAFAAVPIIASSTYEQYTAHRDVFMTIENSLSINAAWELTAEEAVVDELLQQMKNADNALDPVPVQFNFVTMQPTIDKSPLFTLMKSLPKGSLLHSHDTSALDMHFYVEASYLPGCLYNTDVTSSEYGFLTFKSKPNYVPIENIRSAWPGGAAAFDEELYKNFTLLQFADQPNTTGDEIWEQFQPIFGRLSDMFYYLPIFRKFFAAMFPLLLEDGLSSWEMRTDVSALYDDTRTYSQAEAVGVILEELAIWKENGGDEMFGFGIVLQGIRNSAVEDVIATLETAYDLHDLYPDTIIGFDLVGHEDPGYTLQYWAPYLLEAQDRILKERNSTYALPFFFHAGESNRLDVQENLVDAVLLNSSRIGHGFGLQEFPALWPVLKKHGILIEACPISNQVLGLVVDQRNHPIGQMLHHAHVPISHASEVSPKLLELLQQYPKLESLFHNFIRPPLLAVSINNDDPGFWGIDGIVSYDWYVAVLAWDLNVGALKQLAIDSIVHSAAPIKQRAAMLEQWSGLWEMWIRDVARAAMHM